MIEQESVKKDRKHEGYQQTKQNSQIPRHCQVHFKRQEKKNKKKKKRVVVTKYTLYFLPEKVDILLYF